MATVLYNTNVDCTSGFIQSPCIGLLLFFVSLRMIWELPFVDLLLLLSAVNFLKSVVLVNFEMTLGLPFFGLLLFV